MEKRKRKGYANATEARSNVYDLAEGNTRDGIQKHVSRACEKGIRMPSVRMTTGSRGVVGTAGRGLNWDGESTNNTFTVALYKTGLAESSRSQGIRTRKKLSK
jgi:hypothetical protein